MEGREYGTSASSTVPDAPGTDSNHARPCGAQSVGAAGVRRCAGSACGLHTRLRASTRNHHHGFCGRGVDVLNHSLHRRLHEGRRGGLLGRGGGAGSAQARRTQQPGAVQKREPLEAGWASGEQRGHATHRYSKGSEYLSQRHHAATRAPHPSCRDRRDSRLSDGRRTRGHRRYLPITLPLPSTLRYHAAPKETMSACALKRCAPPSWLCSSCYRLPRCTSAPPSCRRLDAS